MVYHSEPRSVCGASTTQVSPPSAERAILPSTDRRHHVGYAAADESHHLRHERIGLGHQGEAAAAVAAAQDAAPVADAAGEEDGVAVERIADQIVVDPRRPGAGLPGGAAVGAAAQLAEAQGADVEDALRSGDRQLGEVAGDQTLGRDRRPGGAAVALPKAGAGCGGSVV